jgi:hypothetical protein
VASDKEDELAMIQRMMDELKEAITHGTGG